MHTEAGSKLETATTAAIVAANQSAVDAAIAAATAANSYAAPVQAAFNAGQLPPASLMPALMATERLHGKSFRPYGKPPEFDLDEYRVIRAVGDQMDGKPPPVSHQHGGARIGKGSLQNNDTSFSLVVHDIKCPALVRFDRSPARRPRSRHQRSPQPL